MGHTHRAVVFAAMLAALVLSGTGGMVASAAVSASQLIQQGSKLDASDEIGAAGLGSSVAFSADGNTALIGSGGVNTAGAAWVFTRSGGVWTQQGPKLTASDEVGNGAFGFTVALSADGNTALIGGPIDNNNLAGAAWVFTRSGGTWTQQGAKLTANDEAGGSEFGFRVALSSDGNTVLIGGYNDNSITGAAWAFTRAGTTWTQQGAKLTGAGEVGHGQFGISVALSSDGNTALIGANADNGHIGAGWVFTRSGSAWTQQGAKLTATGEVGMGGLGTSVAISADGNTAIIGGATDNGAIGAAWMFTRSGSAWTQQGTKLTPGDETGSGDFGSAVALSSDGNTALIGGSADNGNVGAGWTFTRSGSLWGQQGSKLVPSDETGTGAVGSGVALSSDGNSALIGGPGDAGSIGSAWVFVAPAPDSPTSVSAAPGSGDASVSFTASAAPVISYTATASPGGATATAAASPIVVTGLTNGTAYTFTVTATNSVGTSAPSFAASAVTPVGVPGVVTRVTATGFIDAVTVGAPVSFTAPASNGGSAITAYTVTASPGGDTATGTTSPITVTGLTAETTYTFTVTASNSAGAGPASVASPPLVFPVGRTSGGGSSGGVSAIVPAPSAPAFVPVATTPAVVVAAPIVKLALASSPFASLASVKTILLGGSAPKLTLAAKLTRAARLTLTLRDAKGHMLARWVENEKAGTLKLALALPVKARHAGHDTLRITAAGTSKVRVVPVLLSRRS